MRHRFIIFLLSILFMIYTVGTAVTAKKGDNKAPALMASLSGKEEVPKVNTAAQGKITFHLSDDGEELYYKLDVAGIRKIIGAHIRLGAKGENGRVVVILFNLDNPWTSSINSAVVKGVITSDNLVGPLYGQPLKALLREMENSYTYVSIRTAEYPSGHIRGQIIGPSHY